MSVRLYPDIIVAAEVNNRRRAELMRRRSAGADDTVSTVTISIEGCLARQQDYKHIGLRDVFVGFEDKEWTAWDYGDYLARLPEYVEPAGSEYRFNLSAMIGDARGRDVPLAICDKLFILGTYPGRVLQVLGLYSYE